jgi:hypothetical protein
MSKSYEDKLRKIKGDFPKAYESWSAEDDELLRTSYAGGMSIDSLAKSLQRRPNAIRSRLRKLGVSVPNDNQVYNQPAPLSTKSNNPINDMETATSSLVAKSIAPLDDADPLVYSLLINKIQNGFFEKPQSKNAVNALADRIIEAISQTGGQDAY